jgi:hypothetical protein
MIGIASSQRIFEHAPPALLPAGRQLTVYGTNAEFCRIFGVSQTTVERGSGMVPWTSRRYETIAEPVDTVTSAATKGAAATGEQAATSPKITHGIQQLPDGTDKAGNEAGPVADA